MTEAASPRLIDDRTVVISEGSDLSGSGRQLAAAAPVDETVERALATVATAPELEWAKGHTRFILGPTSEGDAAVYIQFACDRLLTSPKQALDELRNVLTAGDGGDCYGFALFDTEGGLLEWDNNGES